MAKCRQKVEKTMKQKIEMRDFPPTERAFKYAELTRLQVRYRIAIRDKDKNLERYLASQIQLFKRTWDLR